jgi:hypothetical protein
MLRDLFAADSQPTRALTISKDASLRCTVVPRATRLQVSAKYYSGPRQTWGPLTRGKMLTWRLSQCGFARPRALMGSMFDEDRNMYTDISPRQRIKTRRSNGGIMGRIYKTTKG